jgi:uncharacterized protein (DUF736 family)
MGAAEQPTETTMATIGTFTASDNGYVGSIKTLTLNIKARFSETSWNRFASQASPSTRYRSRF